MADNTQIYVTGDTKKKLDELCAQERRGINDEVYYLCVKRLKELKEGK